MTARCEPLEDLDAATLRVGALLTRLRTSSYAGAAYGALCALERCLQRYASDEAAR